MKLKFTSALFSLFIIAVIYPNIAKSDTTTVYFTTLGNCYLCQLRIEEAVNRLEGIEAVNWDYNTDITTVTYEDGITDPFIIMDAIALVGHDTEWYPAPDSSYQTLVGTCCEYERILDYTNVQVGYLSLMGIWVYPVGIHSPEMLHEISIYPSAGTGKFHISLNNTSGKSGFEVSVYSMNGSRVHSTHYTDLSGASLDLGALQKGQYVVVVTENHKVIARSKLIKM